jgi:hypothetical protein
MNQTPLAMLLLIAVTLTLNANAEHMSLNVDTNTSHWSIYRQSINLSFHLSSLVEGNVSPVESNGRILSPYQSYYEDIGTNDVRLRQRTNALEGSYKSSDEIGLQSVVDLSDIEISIKKPPVSPIYTIEYKNEIWPVFLRASRSLAYAGKQINNRDFEGNNGDFVGANFLYNHELSKDQRSVIWLQRANATVLATDDAILLAEFKPTKYLGNFVQAKTTGIADLSYMQRDSMYDTKHNIYPAIGEGEERYYGDYNLARKIEMRSIFEEFNDTDEADYLGDSWLPCCNGGWDDMRLSYQKGFGNDANKIFDCTCYKG